MFYINLQPDLPRANVTNKENELSFKTSPDGRHTLRTYIHGGQFFRTDYSFLGVVESEDSEPSSIFLVGEDHNFHVSWIDSETLFLETMGEQHILNIFKDTYDYRR